MEKKKVLHKALDLCKQGKFQKSLNTLHSVEEIDNKWVMAILVACCNVCVANNSSPENIPEHDLLNLLKHIIGYIKNIPEDELFTYIVSLYYILKLFIDKKCYELIAKMENILIPPFLSSSLPEKHVRSYQSLASSLHDFIIKSEHRQFESSINICIIMAKMYARVSCVSAVISTSFNCMNRLSHLSCPINEQVAHFFKVLSLVKADRMKVNTEGDFKNFLCHFTLIYNNLLKEFNFKEAAIFYEKAFQIGTEIFNNDDCRNLLILLRFPLLLCPLNLEGKLESLMNCKRSLSNLENSAQKQLVGVKLYYLIHFIVVSYYKSKHGSEWRKFSEVSQLELLQFISEVGRLELLPKFTCPCACLIKKNVHRAFLYSQFIYTLIEISVCQKGPSSDFNRNGAKLLLQFCEDVKTLKEYNCENWKTAWGTLGVFFYNIGVYLKENSDEGCLHYIYNLIKYYIKFEFRSSETVLKPSVVEGAFIIACNYSQKNYKKYMALSALAVKLGPNQRNGFMTNWMKAKVNQRDAKTAEGDEAQKITLVSAFKLYKKEMEFLTDGANLLTETDKIDLLIFELEQYRLKWKSKVPMMSALKELCALVDLDKFVEVVVTIFGDCELMLHDDVLKILHSTLVKYEEKVNKSKSASVLSTIFLAILYHMYYNYCAKDVITKNSDDMQRTMSVKPKTDESPSAIPKDPNEECDIVSSYECLKLDRYFCVMKYLNRSLELFASVINDDFDPSVTKKITSVYDLLMKISMTYRLHRYSVKNLQALQLALKVAQIENNPLNIVQATGFIIENSDINRSYVKDLMLTADELLDDIKFTSVSNLKIVLTYYVCKVKSLLYEDYKEAFRIFQLANKLYDTQEDKSELNMIKSQLHLLHFKFVLMPCDFGIVDHQKSTLLTIHQANAAVYEEYNRTKLDGSYEMSVLLDANEELARLYYFLRCPREMRAYCKETIILAQQLVLPIRCAYYLVYLAHADLRSLRYDDGQVKIDGLADILCLTKYNVQIDQENRPPPCEDVNTEVDIITNDMREMVLDLSVSSRYEHQFSLSSPILVIEPFHLPAFLNHDDGCDCFYCISLEYKSLVLEKARLDALLNIKRKKFSISMDFFRGALNFYDISLKKYQSSVETVTKFIPYDLVPEFKKELLEAYGFNLLDYSYHLRRNINKAGAKNITNKLINLVSLRKVQHIYLYNEALFQKLGYLTENITVTPTVDLTPEKDTLSIETDIMSTTPESKQSKVTFSLQQTPNFSPPKRRVKKCLPFNLSPYQESSSGAKAKDKASPNPKQPKTPVPKIKIFSDEGTIQKSKNPSSVQGFKSESKRNKKKVPLNGDSVTPSAPLKTPRPARSERELKTRTKLLTEKLKQSSKKPDVPEEPEVDNMVNGKKSVSVRKNLFEHEKEEKGPNVPQGGAVRRTARNRKV